MEKRFSTKNSPQDGLKVNGFFKFTYSETTLCYTSDSNTTYHTRSARPFG